MIRLLDKMFYFTAISGFMACAVAGIVRLSGHYYILGFEAITLLMAGIALMVFACVLKLECISEKI